MKRFVVFAFCIAACRAEGPAERYGFVTTLGRDTISVENVNRRGNTITTDAVDRFPRVRQRRTIIELDDRGGVKRLVMDIHTPSEPPSQRDRRVEAIVTRGQVRLSKTDSSATVERTFDTGDAIAMAHVPQMYSLYELYFMAARSSNPNPGDTARFRQFYPDREFDSFPLHRAFVWMLPGSKAEIRHDWLSGIGEATLDNFGRLLTYSGSRTTYDVRVTRVDEPPDIQAVAARFTSAESTTGEVRPLSVRDTVRARIGNADFTVDYSRPLARGRVLLGTVIRYGSVWRTGANTATQFSTSRPVTIAGLPVPAGNYTLWTVPREDGADLIVNKQTGQWGTGYNAALNLGRARLATETLAEPVEKFTISIVPLNPRRGTLSMEWGTFRWSAPITVR